MADALLQDLDQVRDFGHHAANRAIVGPLNHLIQARESQTLHHFFVLYRRADCGTHPLELNRSAAPTCFLCRHNSSVAFRESAAMEILSRRSAPARVGQAYNSCTVLPRKEATPSRLLRFRSASNVALITLCGFVVPIDLVSTFCTPAEVMTARTAPPAMTPVPSGAGLSSTLPEP